MTTNKLRTATALLVDYAYSSDNTGNITAIADQLAAGYNRTFTYDDLSRLTAASTGASLWGAGAYTYDRMGNMQSFTLGTSRSGSFTYSGITPKVATTTENGVTSTVTYDAAGNELTGGSMSSFLYSSRNLVQSDGTNTYTHDGRGVRVLTTGPRGPRALQGPATITSSYSPDLHLLSQTLDDGAFHLSFTDYLWLGALPIAQADATTLTTTFTDHLGTPILQTDPTAAITWQAEYEPYGRIHTMRHGPPSPHPSASPARRTPAGRKCTTSSGGTGRGGGGIRRRIH